MGGGGICSFPHLHCPTPSIPLPHAYLPHHTHMPLPTCRACLPTSPYYPACLPFSRHLVMACLAHVAGHCSIPQSCLATPAAHSLLSLHSFLWLPTSLVPCHPPTLSPIVMKSGHVGIGLPHTPTCPLQPAPSLCLSTTYQPVSLSLLWYTPFSSLPSVCVMSSSSYYSSSLCSDSSSNMYSHALLPVAACHAGYLSYSQPAFFNCLLLYASLCMCS